MLMYVLKVLISAIVIVAVSEIAKTNALLGGLIKSLPLVSLLSFLWLYIETQDLGKVGALSSSTFYFVLPSLPMFLLFPLLLRQSIGFWLAFGISVLFLLLCYWLAFMLIQKLEISF